jgi:DNA-binding CsgD family transcriptional regulator
MNFPSGKFHSQFIDLFPSANAYVRSQLKSTLQTLEETPNSFAGAAWLNSQDYSYISPDVEGLLGHPFALFHKQGVLFVQSITPLECIPKMRQQAESHFAMLNDVSFDLAAMQTFMVDGALRSAEGRIYPCRCTSVVLDRNHEYNGFFVVANWQCVDIHNTTPLFTDTTDVLIRIKQLYLKLYPDRFRNDRDAISAKEMQVLKLLAQGLTTKEIGGQLGISFHTVESHRKNLIKKFEAQNTIELLTKTRQLVNVDAL